MTSAAPQDLQKYADDLDTILEVSRSMGGLRDIDELLDIILAAAKRLLDADRCSCFVVDDVSGELLTRVAQGSETIRLPRGSGLAGAVAESREVLNLPDVYADSRFNPDNDRATGYRTKSMLCLPLISYEDKVVGVLQALNKRGAESFDAYDEKVATALCGHAAVAIDTNQLVARDRERQRMVRDLELAQDIQRSLLPVVLPEMAGWRFAAWQRTCDETGGDYYDFIEDEGSMDLVVGDVSGHGIGAALYMSAARAFLRGLDRSDLAQAYARLNDLLEADLAEDAFMTMVSARIWPAGRVRFCSAGHEPPAIYRPARDSFDELDSSGLLLGALPGSDYDLTEVEPLVSGDVLICFTDGIFEAANAEGEEWGMERFYARVRERASQGAQGLLGSIVSAVDAWIGDRSVEDDWTIVVAERL